MKQAQTANSPVLVKIHKTLADRPGDGSALSSHVWNLKEIAFMADQRAEVREAGSRGGLLVVIVASPR